MIRTILAGALLAGPLGFPPSAIAGEPVESVLTHGKELPGETFEELDYRWQLTGFVGRLAGLFFPSSGGGQLATSHLPQDRLATRLRIESEQSRHDEFWAYGARLESGSGDTVAVWSAYRWRGEESTKREQIQDPGVVDVVSGIYRLRRHPPSEPRHMEIWSDGKIYPVIVRPREERYFAIADRTVKARLLEVRGQDVPGRRRWNGWMDLWLTQDDAAIPVRIVVDRGWARVQLDLAELPDLPEVEESTLAGSHDGQGATFSPSPTEETDENQKEISRRTL